MGKLVDRKEDNVTTVVHLNQKKEIDGSQFAAGEQDYRKLLEEKIKEKILNLHLNVKDIKGALRENLQKKRAWMAELIKPISEIKDILEHTELLEIKLIYRRKNVALSDLKSITIKTVDYDESSLVKSGFKLDIDFCPRSQALNNKQDCYLVQLLGHNIEQEPLQKYYNLNTLMDFIINYCSEYIAEFSQK
jgi:hypothetical protein